MRHPRHSKLALWALAPILALGLVACASQAAPQTADSAGDAAGDAGQTPDASLVATEVDPGTLVVYFSETGHTEAIAADIADDTGAAIAAIEPTEPYSETDLTTYSSDTRPSRESKDPSARPGFTLSPQVDPAAYGEIYLGYPIWFGTAPRIIDSFLDAYDLSGATIHLFCTSGSTGIQTSVADLREAHPTLHFEGEMRFAAGAPEADVAAWVDETRVS